MPRELDLTLEKAIQAGQSAEETRRQIKLITKTSETENIDSVVEIVGNLNIEETFPITYNFLFVSAFNIPS